MWLYVLLNIISMICWTFLAVRFDMWWIALFALLFMFIPKQVTVRKHYRICDKCGKHSPYADSQDEAISKAKKIGGVSYQNVRRNNDNKIQILLIKRVYISC